MENIVAAPVVEGVPQNGSQATEPPPQEAVQPQETTTTQVEGTPQTPTSTEPERKKPSDFYRERSKMRSLEDTIKGQQARMEQMENLLKNLSSGSPSKPNIPDYLQAEILSQNPTESLMKFREEILKEAENRFNENVPKKFGEFEKSRESEKKMQEALELLFPNSDGNVEPLEVRVSKNQEKADNIQSIIMAKGLNALDPLIAAEIALSIYDKQNTQSVRPPNPNAIKKNLMGVQATGQPAGGGKKMPTLQELRAESKKHDSLTEENPDLRMDQVWLKKRSELKSAISVALQELGSGK